MEETHGEAVSLSMGTGNHSGTASQAAPSPRLCPAPSRCEKLQGKMPGGLQKLLLL